MKFSRRLFTVAGVYGLFVLIPQYFMEEKTGRDFPPPITHPEFYYGFVGVAIVFQVLFLILSRDPVRYRPMMIPAILEKVSFGIPVIVLFLQHRIPPMILGSGILDLVFAALFTMAYVRTAE